MGRSLHLWSSASYPSALQLQRFCGHIDRDGLWHRSVPLFWGWATRDSPQQTSDQDSLLLNCSFFHWGHFELSDPSTGTRLPQESIPWSNCPWKQLLDSLGGLKPLYHNKENYKYNTSEIINLLHHLLLILVIILTLLVIIINTMVIIIITVSLAMLVEVFQSWGSVYTCMSVDAKIGSEGLVF